MRNSLWVCAGVVSSFVLVASCGGGDVPAVFVPPAGGAGGAGGAHAGGSTNRGGSGGKGSGGHAGSSAAGEASGGELGAAGSTETGDAGEGGVGGASQTPNSPAPVVAITFPTAATDPNVGPVLVANDSTHLVTVLCVAKESSEVGAFPVDASSVKIALVDANNQITQGSARSTGNAGEFAADFELRNPTVAFAAGKVTFTCAAKDTAAAPSTGTASVSTFVDRGPTVTIGSPGANTKNALSTPLPINFTVAPAPLASGDSQAAVGSVNLKVNGVTVPLPAPDAQGHYSLSVDLNDKTAFPTTPTGTVPIAIEATDARAPNAAANLVTYNVVVDGTPPVIVIATPTENGVVGQQIALTFSITDDLSGVAPTSVYVEVSGTQYSYSTTDTRWQAPVGGSGTYVFTFPSSLIPNANVKSTVMVYASDGAGNASPGVSRDFYLDTSAPFVDLDPLPLRERRSIVSKLVCSDPFDPVGAAAANDQQTVPDAALFRALVWDMSSASQYAGVDAGSVVLYAQPHTATTLLTNKNGGTQCDTAVINDATYPAKVLSLSAIAATGSPSFSTASGAITGVCDVTTQAATTPLCSGTSDLTAVIQQELPSGAAAPAIFGSGSVCSNNQWTLPQNVASADGWICMVAVAADKAGNVGVSAPLRVCLDATSFPGTPPCTDPTTAPPPSCTDGCTPPAHFNPTWIDQ